MKIEMLVGGLMIFRLIGIGFAFALAGCASTAVTPMAANQVMISTSAAPACGMSGAQRVAAQMAAVETLRRGFERFTIVGMGAQNNVRMATLPPTMATTTGTLNTYGNTTYGNATTTFSGGGPIVFGSNDANLVVVMYRKGESGYRNAVDARSTLGEDWHEKVEKGINTCS
ncbi:hypothetical protein [Thalassovita sp.]|uniref:hypothetical protein n=1 Tax=Thalassovita sp. TaxID=1979401 RepID=UPI0029DE5E5E|nr:hypothetical protein [Thalassovita sp.]